MIHAAGQITTKICDMVMDEGRVPMDWKLNTLISINKVKGAPLVYGSYLATELLECGLRVLGFLEQVKTESEYY